MPDVMDANARVFDTISDKITVIGGKFKEFAAGVLGEMTPMLEIITTALAGIDMAGFGQRLAQAFIGGTAAMEGFTSALGALKVGEFSLAFEMAWASIKLQAKQTANEIYLNMVAAFSAAAEFLTDVLGPYSAIYGTISNAFVVLGKSLASSIASSLTPIFEALPVIGTGIGESMREAVKNLDGELDRATKRMNAYGGMIKDDLTDAGKAFPESFKSAYEATQPFINVQDDMQEVNRLAGEINKTAAGLTWNMMSQVEKLPQLTWNMKDHMKEGAGAMERAAKTVKETLSLSEQIVKRIKEAAGNDKVDKGGKLEKAAGDAIAEGDFRKAERIAEKLKGKEQDAAIDEAFGGDKKGRLSTRDMAKSAGIDTTGKSNKELKKEMQDRIDKRKDELPEGKRGKDEKEAGGNKAGDPMSEIQKAVQAIQKLVEKIEPKLPTAALGV
jgi:phage host-nuclease inhibitor protein Gam